MVRQVAGPVGPESLFVRHRRERQSAIELGAQLPQVQESENRGGGAAFHVAGAAPVNAAVDEFAAPGIARPAGAVTHREAVYMAIECEVTAEFPGLECRDDIGHDLVGRNHATIRAVPRQELTDVVRRLACVARRVRAWATDEATEEIKQHLAVALNPLQQLCLAALHFRPSDDFGIHCRSSSETIPRQGRGERRSLRAENGADKARPCRRRAHAMCCCVMIARFGPSSGGTATCPMKLRTRTRPGAAIGIRWLGRAGPPHLSSGSGATRKASPCCWRACALAAARGFSKSAAAPAR